MSAELIDESYPKPLDYLDEYWRSKNSGHQQLQFFTPPGASELHQPILDELYYVDDLDWLLGVAEESNLSLADALHEHRTFRLEEAVAAEAARNNRNKEVNFWSSMLQEALQANYQGRRLKGPYTDDFNDVLSEVTDKLNALNSSLPIDALMPPTYQKPETAAFLGFLGADLNSAVQELRISKQSSINSLTATKLTDLKDQVMPSGLLHTPEFIYMTLARGCALTNIAMILKDITGNQLNYGAFKEAVYRLHDDYVLDDEEYLKLFTTPQFKERFSKEVQTISFSGADFDFIRLLSTKIKDRLPECSIYCMVSLLTESSSQLMQDGVWHFNILLSVSNGYVRVNDPSRLAGAGRQIPKESFIRRWAQAYNRGHLVIVR